MEEVINLSLCLKIFSFINLKASENTRPDNLIDLSSWWKLYKVEEQVSLMS